MKILSRRHPKDPFASSSISDLRKAEALLKCRIGTLESESQDLKEKIQNLLDDGASICDEPRDAHRAMRIRTLIEQYHMKNAVCVKLERDLRLISYIIAMRDRDRMLNLSDACQKLNRISPDKLEEWLAKQSVHEEGDRNRVEDLQAILSEQIPGGKDHPVDETSIRQAMEEIRGGAVPVAVIVKNLLDGSLSGKERIRTTITQYDKFPGKQGRDEQ
jgi:hypothetical protein|nr:hypothetical protein [Methanoculleus marisnigri]